LQSLVAAVERLDPLTVSGRVAAVNGLLIEARGGLTRLAVGARAEIVRYGEKPLSAEVVGFRDDRALLMPFGPVEGVAPGAEIRIEPLGSPSESRSTARDRCRKGSPPIRCAPRPRRPMPAPAWASGWTWACAP
jgi:flagellar biosynthesis/type III secretory pathway ATPase